MRYIFALCAFLFTLTSFSQDYVDIFNVSFSEGLNTEYEDGTGEVNVRNIEARLTYPIVLDEKNAIITGVDFSRTNLRLTIFERKTNLYSTTLKIGWAKTWNERWSSTLVFLPKVASDYEVITADDLYFGGYGVLKYLHKENLMYRFGLYGSSEAFGPIITPIVGLYYTSPDDLWEVDLSLPITANINYIVAKNLKVGADYIGLGRSYRLNDIYANTTYVQQNSLEFSAYLEKAFVEQSILIRLKAGYSNNDYEEYFTNQTIDLALSAFRFGDNRRQLNKNINGAPFLKIEAIYRFYIDDSSKE